MTRSEGRCRRWRRAGGRTAAGSTAAQTIRLHPLTWRQQTADRRWPSLPWPPHCCTPGTASSSASRPGSLCDCPQIQFSGGLRCLTRPRRTAGQAMGSWCGRGRARGRLQRPGGEGAGRSQSWGAEGPQ